MHATDLPDRSDDAAEDEPRETWVEPIPPAPGIEGQYRREIDSDGHTTVTIEVTMTDPELAAMEVCLATLQTLPYDVRVRVLSYVRSRVESDPAVWGSVEPAPTRALADHHDVARIIAEADRRDWHTMSEDLRLTYYHRADALLAQTSIELQ